MLPIAQCVHKLPERARLRIPSRKGDSIFFSGLRERLHRCDQVTGVETNHLTGSALIFYAGDFAAVAGYAEKEGIFRLEAKKHNPNSLTHVTVDTYKRLDSQVKRLTGGEIDVPSAAWVALAGAGIYQIARGNFAAPAWYTAFWYALNIFLKAKGKGVPE